MLYFINLLIVIIVIVLLPNLASAHKLTKYHLSDEYINFLNGFNSTWTAGRNFHKNISLSYLKSLASGVVFENYEELVRINKTQSKRLRNVLKLPKNFDSRHNWSKCRSIINHIRDQGECGSCWAIAGVSVMSDRLCIHLKGKKKIQLSAADLITCCPDCEEKGKCKGGNISNAWKFWKERGLVSGSDYNSNNGCKTYPFTPCSHYGMGNFLPCDINNLAPIPECKNACDNGKPISNELYKCKEFYAILQSEENFKEEIFENGPIQGTMEIYTDFLHYERGIYQHLSGEKLGEHSIKILGWGIKNKIPYWLCANTWNTSWGKKGYFKIIRGVNNCKIETYAIAGLPITL